MNVRRAILAAALGAVLVPSAPAEEPPITPEARARRQAGLEQVIAAADRALKAKPKDLEALSRRGDARFFLGRFPEALADYDAMTRVDPSLAKSHWRRGLAAYYAGQWQAAAEQFERCYGEDDVDRENGIWRYFAQRKAHGQDRARRELLKYAKDDRPPLPAVYDLIQGTKSAQDVLASAETGPADRRAMRRFYADLYVGLVAALDGDRKTAKKHLAEALRNKWAPRAGYGPRYMWEIALLEYDAAVPKTASPQRVPAAGSAPVEPQQPARPAR
jgi:lipoprotein NlpI